MREAFNEARLADSASTLDRITRDFDWDDLFTRLGETVANPDSDDARLAEAVARLLQALLPKGRDVRLATVGLRVVALAWVLSPGYFVGQPSIRTLARRCRIDPGTLAQATGNVSRRLNWRNRAQRTCWNWAAGDPQALAREEQLKMTRQTGQAARSGNGASKARSAASTRTRKQNG